MLITVAVTLLFRFSPRRRQPRLSWLSFGAARVGVRFGQSSRSALACSTGLARPFGQTYGPLAGLIALLLWCLLSAMALLFGAAVAAQLESVRAGELAPQDAEKVAESEPDADQKPVPVPS